MCLHCLYIICLLSEWASDVCYTKNLLARWWLIKSDIVNAYTSRCIFFTKLQCHYGQWDGKFQSAISPSIFSKSGWNLYHSRAETISIFRKCFSEIKIPLTPKKCNFWIFFRTFVSRKWLEIFFAKFSEFVAIQIAHMAFLSNWGWPLFFVGKGGKYWTFSDGCVGHATWWRYYAHITGTV